MIIYLDSDFEGNSYNGFSFDEGFFLSIVQAAAEEGVDFSDAAELSLVLSTDEFIRKLNLDFRGLDAPTDVLSFPQEDDELLGDIVISLETAERKAVEIGCPLREEAAFLFIHGLLHLKGYDHSSEKEEAEMFSLQERCLKRWRDKQ
ncbi:MAG: rRNA maturation RNase YbeY [Deferribacteraceae bacterium]|jgi:probable rRNA maturation factor|nr:rRNA maturation RNase YbeY [Deferribacteraceae bacterium]